jgi:hypothetical protein
MFISRMRIRFRLRGLRAPTRSARLTLPPVAALAALLLGCLAAPALAGEPATVTVRVVGANNQALVPLTQVTTTTAPVVKGGNPASDSCPGTNALGALQLATNGNWEGPWSSEFNQYEVLTIAGESHPFETPKANMPTHYWNFWLDNKEASAGACEAELHNGDSILFFVGCSAVAAECQAAPNAQDVLGIEMPATAEVEKPVTVKVLSYPVEGGGAATPAVGATVVGGGDASALPTNAQGQTTLTFSGDGRYTIHASGAGEGPTSVPAETFVCVHEGNDGTCGTTAPTSNNTATRTGSVTVAPSPYSGPFALVAKAVNMIEGHFYDRGHAPRELKGVVLAHTAVTSVSISLRRSYKRRCYAFDSARGRFVKGRCGQDRYFKVAGGSTSFSYLLPAQLPPGRYVFDTEATDAAGNRTTLARGSSRFVFYVR